MCCSGGDYLRPRGPSQVLLLHTERPREQGRVLERSAEDWLSLCHPNREGTARAGRDFDRQRGVADQLTEIGTLAVHAERAGLCEPPPCAEGIVAGSENLDSGRGKRPELPIAFAPVGGSRQEGCLGLIELPSDLTHRRLVHRVGVRDPVERT